MHIVEGTYQGKKIECKPTIILAYEYIDIFTKKEESLFGIIRCRGKYEYIYFKNKLVSVEVVSQEQATGGGVQGAAGGALEGFLLAGLLDSAIGAGIGRNKSGKDNTIFAIITWTNGDFWVVKDVDNKELTALQHAVAFAEPKQISTLSIFLKTYKKIFDETWDKRIRVAIKELKEKEAKAYIDNYTDYKAVTPQPAKSKKDQLIELKELLEQELISEDEYEQSRKKILGLDS